MPMRFRLKELKKEKGLTYRQIEAGANVSKSILSKMGTNKQRQVSLDVLDRLTDFLRCELNDLIIKTDNKGNNHG